MTEAGLYSDERIDPIALSEERDCYMVTLFMLVEDRVLQMLERGIDPDLTRRMARDVLAFICDMRAAAEHLEKHLDGKDIKVAIKQYEIISDSAEVLWKKIIAKTDATRADTKTAREVSQMLTGGTTTKN